MQSFAMPLRRCVLAARRVIQRAAFAALYGPVAPAYDAVTRRLFLGEWERWQRAALAYLPASGTILELGAGTGRLAEAGVGPMRHWLAIEPSAAMSRVARQRSSPAGPWLVRADARRLPVRSGTADAVVATFPTGYILDPVTAAEIRRVLKPAAPVVIVLSGELAAHGWARRWRRCALRVFYGGEPSPVSVFALAGFAGRCHRVVTPHGAAAVYVATPA